LRRVLYTLIAGALVAALIPATALGHSHHRRHRHAGVHHKIRHNDGGSGHDGGTTTTATAATSGGEGSSDSGHSGGD